MPIPTIKRSGYNGLVKDRRFSDIPEEIKYMYCNCQSGVDHAIVLLTDGDLQVSAFGSWYCQSGHCRHIVELTMNPVITTNPRKMIVRFE